MAQGQQVAHQRLVAIIVDECPLFGVGRSIEHVLLLFELDAPGLLGKIARSIAAFADGAGFGEQGIRAVADDAILIAFSRSLSTA